jgi:hypothetical protein
MHEIDEMLKLQLEGKHKEARALSDKLERIGKDKILDPTGKNTADIWLRHSFNRGWFLLNDGDFQAGSQALEHGRFLKVYGSPQLKTYAPIYNPNIHDIKGKSIIISLEGGYGDEIIHARFATSYKKLGADKVYIAASPDVSSLMGRIEGVDKVILRTEAHTVKHDYWMPGFSAGWIAGHTYQDLPNSTYITPLDNKVSEWKEKLSVAGDKIKVGIRWAGNPKFEHQQYRRFPENFITNLSKYSELQLFSFQRDDNVINLPENIIDLQDDLTDWEETLGAIANLDIMITSCTSVAHVAAGMGKETWVIVPILPYHTWAYNSPESRTSPWYKTVKLFRQVEKLKWNKTFQLLYKELEEKFNLAHIEHTNEDKEFKQLNLGCGFQQIENFINIDNNPLTRPDLQIDLNQFPWPFEDNSVNHIIAKNILEYLGESNSDIIKIIKEMYRISTDAAAWEIQIPHWRSDLALENPNIKRVITAGTFKLFDKFALHQRIEAGFADQILAFEHDIDVSISLVNIHYNTEWEKLKESGKITEEQLVSALNTNNNVAHSVTFAMNVHKPGRANVKELEEALEKIKAFDKIKVEPTRVFGN